MKPHRPDCICVQCVTERRLAAQPPPELPDYPTSATTNTGAFKPGPEVVLIPVQLRDYFAAQALAGLLANSSLVADRGRDGTASAAELAAEVAGSAWGFADAMLQERATSTEPRP